MESLSMRELYARNTENQITLIKNKGDEVIACVVSQLEQLSGYYKKQETREAIGWVLSCFEGHTEQREAEKLTEEQLLLASIVVSAVSDCATIDHYDQATI
jgi:phenylacetate-coenzyme A ligase PaaK-like adenylate-forming protein